MTGSLRALLEAGVAKAPDKVVISADGAELTWSCLHDRACRVAGQESTGKRRWARPSRIPAKAHWR